MFNINLNEKAFRIRFLFLVLEGFQGFQVRFRRGYEEHSTCVLLKKKSTVFAGASGLGLQVGR